MKYSFVASLALVLGASASPVALEERAASTSWGATSNYFLQGMSAAAQQSYLSTLASGGIKVIRFWVNSQPGGNSCTKGSVSVSSCPDLETTIGEYNDATLDLLDQTLVYVGQAGLKAIISPHDANDLNGSNGDDIYGETYGAGYFYEEAAAISAYDARLNHILNYVGKYSATAWKDYSDVIMAFDIENEPFAPKTAECEYSDASSWPCGRAQTMRTTLGTDSPIKISTGGLGGDFSHGCTFQAASMSCAEIDLVAVHRYAGPEASNPDQWSDSYPSYITSANNKLVYLEEWGIVVASYNPVTEFPANTEDMNSAGLPWSYWQLLPDQACTSDDMDQFGFFINSGVDWQSQAEAAASASCPQDWSGIAY